MVLRLPRRTLPGFLLSITPAVAWAQSPRPASVGAGREPSFDASSPGARALYRRAVEAVIWGMPAVNYDLMLQAMIKAGGAPNQVVYWSRPAGWKNQTLTPNPDTIYLMSFFDTKDVGPIVLEIPPAEGGAIVGSVDDCWQAAIEDVGPAGVDKGRGGRYLILPPGHDGTIPDGTIAMRSPTYRSYALLRSDYRSASDADIASAVAYGRRVRVYPLSQAAAPPETRFIDAIDTLFDATIPNDARFFESLDRIVQAEPWLTRDRAMIDPLRSIGIEKGKAFNPDAAARAMLDESVREARAWIDARYEAMYAPPYFAGTHWALPVDPALIEGISTGFADPDSYPVDSRGVTYSFGFFSARHLGQGQFYLFAIHDKDSQPLDGGSTYRLTVPANAPVRLYWSATAYDRATHALIRGLPRSSRSSSAPELRKNPDGSVDVFFGPAAPRSGDSNWVPTSAGGRFEVLFRFYGPERPLFEKTWQLPDIEKIPA